MKWLRKVSVFLGFSRSDKYTRDYLIESNVRTSIYMSVIVTVLETAMLLRRFIEHWMDPAVHELTFHNTFSFVLLFLVGLTMFFFGIMRIQRSWPLRTRCLILMIFAVATFASGCLLPLETFSSSLAKNALQSSLYISVAVFGLAVFGVSLITLKNNRTSYVSPIIVVTLFALTCLIFGMRAGYSDYVDPTGYAEHASKEILAFINMAMYIGALLIWRPVISIGVLGAAFLVFYFVIAAVDPAFRVLPEGDVVNYATLFITLVVIAFSIYHQRVREAHKSKSLEKLANTDTLTGLMSLDRFLLTIRETVAKNRSLINNKAYLFLNVVNFRVYNDHYGFAAGNILLTNVAEIIQRNFDGDPCCRISDDRFAIFTSTEGMMDRLAAARKEITALEAEMFITLRAGSYIHHSTVEDPQRALDKARYACVQSKQNPERFVEYDQSVHDAYHLMQYIVRSIDRAAAEGQIHVHYQPIMWADDGTISCVEALARWDDPRYGFLSPASFIPALEDAQMIHKLDEAMLRCVCRDIRSLIDRGLPVVPASLNLSRLTFSLVDVPKMIEDAIAEAGIPRDMLHLEVTESALALDKGHIRSTIDVLKAKGSSVWIDDFGSGYSSFESLKEFNFDALKIDMSMLKEFNENPKTKTLLVFLIDLAKRLNIETVCEGVETKEIANFLRDNGCDRLQGYYYGRPMPLPQIIELVETGQITFKPDVIAKAKRK